MIDIIEFDSGQAGPHCLILGAVHGNEICGTRALTRIAKELRSGQLVLQKGRATFIPICNPKAYEANVRDTDVNLNRVFDYRENPELYEEKLANVILPHIEKADFLLDIHSYTTDDTAFAIQLYEGEDYDRLARLMPVEIVLKGWRELYKDRPDKNQNTSNVAAHSFGVPAITLECGHHDSPSSIEVAYEASLSFLQGLCGLNKGLQAFDKEQKNYIFKEVHFFEEGSHYEQGRPHHLDALQQGEIIARRQNGTPIRAPQDGYILLPNQGYYEGAEWFYFGVAEIA